MEQLQTGALLKYKAGWLTGFVLRDSGKNTIQIFTGFLTSKTLEKIEVSTANNLGTETRFSGRSLM